MAKSDRLIVAVIALGAMLAASLLIGSCTLASIRFHLAYEEAFREFANSRPDPNLAPSDYAFITRGIEFGDPPEQVDSRMGDARKHGPYDCSEQHPYKVFKRYKSQYGSKPTMIVERYEVFFDEGNGAVAMHRTLFRREHGIEFSFVDLRTRTVSPRRLGGADPGEAME